MATQTCMLRSRSCCVVECTDEDSSGKERTEVSERKRERIKMRNWIWFCRCHSWVAVKSVAASGAEADVGRCRCRRHFLLFHRTMCEWKMHGLHLHSMTSNLILASNGKPPFHSSPPFNPTLSHAFIVAFYPLFSSIIWYLLVIFGLSIQGIEPRILCNSIIQSDE